MSAGVEFDPHVGPDDERYIGPGGDGAWMCGAFGELGYRCTRTEGHAGDHVGHGWEDQMIAQWSR